MKPIIGLFSEIDDTRTASVVHTYVHAVEESGGIPLLIPFYEREDTLARAVDLCDAFLFTGGPDIEPRRYGEATHAHCGEISLQRDDMEFRLLKAVYTSQKPILAICRGIQLVNVFFGGDLIQDLPTCFPSPIPHRQSEPKFAPSHRVQILPSTPLARLIEADCMEANSFHHQAVKHLGRDLAIMARSEDGVIEGLYHTSYPYLRAYQWHPERLYDTSDANRRIFDDFLRAASASSAPLPDPTSRKAPS